MRTGNRPDVQLVHLLDMNQAAAVFEEVKWIFIQSYPLAAFAPVRQTFNDFIALYEGKYPGYRACNTRYHDKIHTTDALLAMARLIDGHAVTRRRLPERDVVVGLIATILHDTGYIQRRRDTTGTGAKYTLNHVERSIDFMRVYMRSLGFSRQDIESAVRMVQCTGLEVKIADLPFRTSTERTLGMMLGSADLMGQMSSRTYLERLVFLFREFREGHVKGFRSEYDLLQKTLSFYAVTSKRLSTTLGGMHRFARAHFRARYHVPVDLYRKAISRQIAYLQRILADPATTSFRHHLRRTM